MIPGNMIHILKYIKLIVTSGIEKFFNGCAL